MSKSNNTGHDYRWTLPNNTGHNYRMTAPKGFDDFARGIAEILNGKSALEESTLKDRYDELQMIIGKSGGFNCSDDELYSMIAVANQVKNQSHVSESINAATLIVIKSALDIMTNENSARAVLDVDQKYRNMNNEHSHPNLLKTVNFVIGQFANIKKRSPSIMGDGNGEFEVLHNSREVKSARLGERVDLVTSGNSSEKFAHLAVTTTKSLKLIFRQLMSDKFPEYEVDSDSYNTGIKECAKLIYQAAKGVDTKHGADKELYNEIVAANRVANVKGSSRANAAAMMVVKTTLRIVGNGAASGTPLNLGSTYMDFINGGSNEGKRGLHQLIQDVATEIKTQDTRARAGLSMEEVQPENVARDLPGGNEAVLKYDKIGFMNDGGREDLSFDSDTSSSRSGNSSPDSGKSSPGINRQNIPWEKAGDPGVRKSEYAIAYPAPKAKDPVIGGAEGGNEKDYATALSAPGNNGSVDKGDYVPVSQIVEISGKVKNEFDKTNPFSDKYQKPNPFAQASSVGNDGRSKSGPKFPEGQFGKELEKGWSKVNKDELGGKVNDRNDISKTSPEAPKKESPVGLKDGPKTSASKEDPKNQGSQVEGAKKRRIPSKIPVSGAKTNNMGSNKSVSQLGKSSGSQNSR